MAQSSETSAQNGPLGPPQEEQSPWKAMFSTISNFVMIYMAINVIKNFMAPQSPTANINPQNEDGESGTTAPFVPPETYSKKLVSFWSPKDELQLRVYVSEKDTLTFPIDNSELVFKSKPVKINEDFSMQQLGGFEPSAHVKNNSTIYAHTYLVKLEGEFRDTQEKDFEFVEGSTVYYRQVLNHYIPLKKKAKLKKLFDSKDGEEADDATVSEDSNVPEVEESNNEDVSKLDTVKKLFKKTAPVVSHWFSNVTIQLVQDGGVLPWDGVHPSVKEMVQVLPLDQVDSTTKLNQFYPIIYFNNFWTLQKNLMPINETVEYLPLNIEFSSTSMWKFQIQTISTVQFSQQLEMMGSDASELDIFKETLIENSPWMLGATVVVSILHSLFDFLAFKNDISFWKQKKDNIGVSVRTLIMNIIFQLITFLYLFDNSEHTSWMIILSSAAGLLIEVWKVTKAMNIELIPSNGTSWFPYKLIIKPKEVSELEEKTDEYDQQAYTYLSYIAYPLLFCYAIYSMFYKEHKGWYSFIINTAVGFVYAFGFITMTPQLFINYKLKSVAHMPGKTFMYKTLNTFVDDMFAFIIKMPLLHRLACLRDDVVFFVYLYQRWIYPEDHTRANEFGQVGEESKTQAITETKQKEEAKEVAKEEVKEETKKEK